MRLWTPADTDTALWLDADDASTLTLDSGFVSEWRDKSGNARHASQATAARRPELVASGLNGMDIVQFDGSDDVLTGSAFVPDSFSAFVVARKRSIAVSTIGWFSQNNNTSDAGRMLLFTERTLSGIGGGVQVGSAYFRSVAATGNFTQWGYTRSGTTATVYINDDSGASGSVGSSAVQATSYAVGAGNNTGSDCSDHDIAEIILLGGVAETASRQRFGGYLAHRWGLESNLPSGHPYKASPPYVYQFSGTARDKTGALAQRRVTVIRESDNTIVDSVLSDGTTGEYLIETLNAEPHTLLFSGEADRNAIVYSGVMPG